MGTVSGFHSPGDRPEPASEVKDNLLLNHNLLRYNIPAGRNLQDVCT